MTNPHIIRKADVANVASNSNEPYLEYAVSGGGERVFGEYLVDRGLLDRFQLLCALQLQDQVPRARLGECAAVLGYIKFLEIEQLYEQFVRVQGYHLPRRVRARTVTGVGARCASTTSVGWSLGYPPPESATRRRKDARDYAGLFAELLLG